MHELGVIVAIAAQIFFWLLIGIVFVVLIVRRIHKEEKEDFEKRDN